MKFDADYKAGCELVLSAADTEIAFDDYAALVKAYRANGFAAIDGTRRDSLETREFLGWTPFDGFAEELVLMLRTAEVHNLSLSHLADLFETVKPEDAAQALYIVEDAAIILDNVEAPV